MCRILELSYYLHASLPLHLETKTYPSLPPFHQESQIMEKYNRDVSYIYRRFPGKRHELHGSPIFYFF